MICCIATTEEIDKRDEVKGYNDGLEYKRNNGAIRIFRSVAYRKGLNKAIEECRND